MSGGYRDPPKARSPALEALAAEARDEAVPVQTELLPPREIERRLELAVDMHDDRPFGLWITAIVLGAIAVIAVTSADQSETALRTYDKILVGLLVAPGIATFIGALWSTDAAAKRRASAVSMALAWAASQPFPITGYRDWLVSDRSILVVQLQTAIDPGTFVDAVKAVEPAIETAVLGNRSFELVIPSRVVTGRFPARYGNVAIFERVFDKVILPLHHDVGVERVTMGGTVHERT